MTVDMSMALGILAIMFILSTIKPFLEVAMGKKKKLSVQAPLRVFGLIAGVLVAVFVYPQASLALSILLGVVFASITDGTYAHILSKIRLQFDEAQKVITGTPAPRKVVTPPGAVEARGPTTVIVDQPMGQSAEVVATTPTLSRSEK